MSSVVARRPWPARLKRLLPEPLRRHGTALFLLECSRKLRERWLVRQVERRVRHLAGLSSPAIHPADAAVLCVVRNGERYLQEFVGHYRAIGVSHIVLLDNGSTDRTREIARTLPGVTLLSCQASFDRYGLAMKQFMIKRYGGGCWVLVADIDELFDYPYSDSLSFEGLLGYLGHNGYTALVTQMLDMFSVAGPESAGAPHASNRDVYRDYDLTGLERMARPKHLYGRRGSVSNAVIPFYQGGLRKTSYGHVCWLTKHALFYGPALSHLDYHEHFVRGGRLADVSGVLYHYLFTQWFPEKCQEAVRRGLHYGGAVDYRAYLAGLGGHERSDGLCLSNPRPLREVNQLVKEGFLHVTREYVDWVRDHARA